MAFEKAKRDRNRPHFLAHGQIPLILFQDLFNRLFNFSIAGTAANIGVKPFFYRLFIGIGMMEHQSMTIHNKPRGTISALEGKIFNKCLLDRCILQALNGRDFLSCCFYRQHQTRFHRPAIDKDGTSSAVAV